MTEAQALRRISDAARAFMLTVRECGPYVNPILFASLKVLITRQFLPIAEQVELAAQREEAR
jgi:hypothetical protein